MLNLLPEDMRGFHRKRLLNSAAFVWGVASILLLVIGLLTLAPAYSFTMIDSNKKDPEQAKTERKTRELADAMRLDLEDDSVASEYVRKFYTTKTFTSLYDVLAQVELKHPSVKVEDISFARGDKLNTITIHGKTATREHLVAFVRDIEAVEQFQNVTLPIGDLAGLEGVFAFTLTIQTAL